MASPRLGDPDLLLARAATAVLAASLLASGCASAPVPERAGPAPAGAVAAPREPAPPAEPAMPAEERGAKLAVACGDFARFSAIARETAVGAERLALELHAAAPGEHRGGRPIAPEVRRALEGVARLYLERCGEAEIIELTSKLIELPTVSAREPASTGESFRAMAAYLSQWSKAAGLELRISGENDAWEIGLGEGAPSVGFVMHGDVVPIDDGVEAAPGRSDSAPAPGTSAIDPLTGEPLPAGWTKPPFRATIADGKLYGRGSEDDKGPIAAALVVMRALAKLGVPTRGRVLAMIGTGEEHDWDGMKRYADSLARKPAFVISVDAEFPVVIAESGFVAWELAAPAVAPRPKGSRCAEVTAARGGQFLTQVPGDAFVTFTAARGEAPEKLEKAARAATAEAGRRLGDGFTFEVRRDGRAVTLTALGSAVHSSVADEGKNALWALATAARELPLCPGGVRTLLGVVADEMAGDHWGERLGIAYSHPEMGRLLVVPTLLRVEGGEVKLGVNMRRPAGKTSAEFGRLLDALTARLAQKAGGGLVESGERYVGEPAVADTSGPLIPTLLEIYRTATGDREARPISIRGGTYARLFPGAVSFGPALPGRPYRGHAPDEYVELEALRLLGRVLLEATLALDAAAPSP